MSDTLLGALRSRFARRGAAPAPDEAAIAAAALRSDRFRLAREGDWRRLEGIVARMESGRLSGLSDRDVLDLPVLYRQLASSLSIARETSLDLATLSYLEALAQRAWFLIYGPRVSFGGWLRAFFAGGWSRAVRAIAPDICVALAVMVAGTVVGWLLVAHDPQWYGALCAGEQVRVPGASRAVLRGTLFDVRNQNMLGVFAAYLFGHNAQIAILCFALGFALGIPTLLLLVQNTGQLGAMLWLFNGQGLLVDLVGWLCVHGTTELFAILLAGAAGLHVGRSIAFPGALPVMEAAQAAGRRAAQVMLGVVIMLLVAGLLEGFARQLIQDTAGRMAVGGFMLVFWLCWFFVAFRKEQP
ncbi:MAG TPA: stage II sporulation protein M [Novosphingobium sp.]|nr:stage II sporulation protein M [Novosphingobium sp.]